MTMVAAWVSRLRIQTESMLASSEKGKKAIKVGSDFIVATIREEIGQTLTAKMGHHTTWKIIHALQLRTLMGVGSIKVSTIMVSQSLTTMQTSFGSEFRALVLLMMAESPGSALADTAHLHTTSDGYTSTFKTFMCKEMTFGLQRMEG